MGALICKKRTATTTKRKRRRRGRRRKSCAEREREQATRTLSQGPSVGPRAPRTLLQGRLWGRPPCPNPLRMGHCGTSGSRIIQDTTPKSYDYTTLYTMPSPKKTFGISYNRKRAS
jgi:hypothetical protein